MQGKRPVKSPSAPLSPQTGISQSRLTPEAARTYRKTGGLGPDSCRVSALGVTSCLGAVVRPICPAPLSWLAWVKMRSETPTRMGRLSLPRWTFLGEESWALVFSDEISLHYEVSVQREGLGSSLRPLSFAGERYAPEP